MKKIISLFLLALSLPVVLADQAEPQQELKTEKSSEAAQQVIVGNNSNLDFSSLDTSASKSDFIVKDASINDMIAGEITMLVSHLKWDDKHMADYQQRYGGNPKQLIIAAFDKNPPAQSTQSDAQPDDKAKPQDKTPQELAEIFSTRDGSELLYLYVSDFEADHHKQDVALFLTEDAQDWLKQQGLIVIPEVIHQQNLVTLKLKQPKYKGGYK